MTVQTFKDYLKSLKFAGSVVDNTQQGIVDAAAEAAFGKVWDAAIWKIGRKLDTSLSTVSGQAYTILPKDVSGVGTVTLKKGTTYRQIDIQVEGNFDYNFPSPSSYSNDMPCVAKMVYNGPASNDKWRLYWYPIPDAVYTMTLTYRFEADITFLPNLPGNMLEPLMLVGSELILPPGGTQAQQFSVAKAALMDAINADEKFTGNVNETGGDVGWNTYRLTGTGGGDTWDPHS